MISSVDSGSIDILLQSYRAMERQPVVRLESQRDGLNDRISLFSKLKTKLTTLESLAKDFTYTDGTSTLGQRTASVSDDSYLTVTAGASSTVTSHSMSVLQLAKADKIVSNQYSLDGTDLFNSLGAGTFTFEVTVNGVANQISVEIAADDDNEAVLDKIVTAVNSTTDIGISASVINDTTSTGRLVFTSDETGAENEMTLTDVTGSLLSSIGMNDSTAMNGTSGGYVYDSGELDAIVEVDGITIQRGSNTIENAVEGLTIELLQPQESGTTPITVNIDHDVENIHSKLEEFVNAYNDIMDFIKTNTGINTTTYERSALSGDFAVNTLKMQLRNLISQPVSGLAAGEPTILAQLGITTDRDGKLSISDSDELDDMLKGNLDQVSALFNSSDGFATRLVDLMDNYTGGDGVIEKRKDVLQGQIKLLNGRIDRMDAMVDRRIEGYRQQFSQLQAAYNQYSAQYASISTLLQLS